MARDGRMDGRIGLARGARAGDAELDAARFRLVRDLGADYLHHHGKAQALGLAGRMLGAGDHQPFRNRQAGFTQ
ncbi:hypothetical protein D3C72_2135400 [compost metagenome]